MLVFNNVRYFPRRAFPTVGVAYPREMASAGIQNSLRNAPIKFLHLTFC